eukprot:TRINITY_DN7897_c0_g1_i1.p1 TRINITY_DN7897_c0_g1~~TRINITY_DN7897_c0_g1_i1.p1  ORF type:complete len:415 (+),score=36.98 TRINITY_DN7897_c0_g1_i1:29-1246(+)
MSTSPSISYYSSSTDISLSLPNPPDLTESLPSKQNRSVWIDQSRGLFILWMILGSIIPSQWLTDSQVLYFFLAHPGTTAKTVTLYDLVMVGFLWIIGLLFSISFQRRRHKQGYYEAVKYVYVRYVMLLVVGLFLVWLQSDGFIACKRNGMHVVRWDVIPSLGLAGLVAIVLLQVPHPIARVLVSVLMMVIYQLCLVYWNWREIAVHSVHGGVLGTIFTFAPMIAMGSGFGEYLLIPGNIPVVLMGNTGKVSKISITYIVSGIIIGMTGILLSFIPEMWPSKRQATLTWCLIAISYSIIISGIFLILEQVQKRITFIYLKAFGLNPMLLYLLMISFSGIKHFLFDSRTEIGFVIIFSIIELVVISGVGLLLYWKNLCFDTKLVLEKFFIFVILPLFFIKGIGFADF